MRCMWWKPALSSADVLWSSGLRVMEPSSQTIRVSLRIAALPPSIAPCRPLGSPPSRSTPSHRDKRAPFGGMFSPAPAVLGVRVCSKTSMGREETPPPTPPPRRARRARLLEDVDGREDARLPQRQSGHQPRHASTCDKCPHRVPPVPLHGWRPTARAAPAVATVAGNYPDGKLRGRAGMGRVKPATVG